MRSNSLSVEEISRPKSVAEKGFAIEGFRDIFMTELWAGSSRSQNDLSLVSPDLLEVCLMLSVKL